LTNLRAAVALASRTFRPASIAFLDVARWSKQTAQPARVVRTKSRLDIRDVKARIAIMIC
jgi:hypothetical protein